MKSAKIHEKALEKIKNWLIWVQVAPFGVSLGRNGATGLPEPLGLLLRPKTGLTISFSGISALGPWGPGPRGPGPRGAVRCGAALQRSLHWSEVKGPKPV